MDAHDERHAVSARSTRTPRMQETNAWRALAQHEHAVLVTRIYSKAVDYLPSSLLLTD
jgi:hypothetical protein